MNDNFHLIHGYLMSKVVTMKYAIHMKTQIQNYFLKYNLYSRETTVKNVKRPIRMSTYRVYLSKNKLSTV